VAGDGIDASVSSPHPHSPSLPSEQSGEHFCLNSEVPLSSRSQAKHQWLTPIILATQKAEIKRISV
jgi:hypothetical protein